MSHRLGSAVIRYRIPILILIILGTAFFGWEARKVKLKSPTIDLFPKDHPYVETYVQYEDIFGGANVVLLALKVKQGDIFNPPTLEKIKRITKALELLPAVNNYQVLSIAQRKIKKTTVDEIEGFKSDPIMWPRLPKTDEEIEAVRKAVYTTGRIHGSLVSLDDQGALIVAGFFEKGLESPGDPLREVIRKIAVADGLDYDSSLRAFEKISVEQVWTLDDTLFDAIEKIAKAEEDENTTLHMIGRPVLLGHIYRNFPQIYKIFLITIFSIILALFLYYRDFRGVLVPVITALISAVWGIGFLGLLGYYFNPLVIVVPFVISARALSHSVQLIERFIGEYRVLNDRKGAAIATFSGLFKPGMISIITDAAGVFIIILTPIPLMEKLALMGSFWVLSIVISDILFNPIFLSLLPPPKTGERAREGILFRLLSAVGSWSYGWQRWPVLITTLVIFVIGYVFARNLIIGDVHPGTPQLWPDSEYNQDTARIGEMFGNTEIMSVVVEGEKKNSIKNPKVLYTMEALQRRLERLKEVSTTNSIADLVPEITKIMHGGDPKWELIPDTPQESGFYLEMIFSGAEPGDLARFITNDFRDANISVYLKDHRGESLNAVIDEAKRFIDSNTMENARFRLAGNYGGLLAAVNEAIVGSQAKVTFMAFMLVFLFCSIAFRSALAGLLFIVPIGISNYLTYALMGALGIGLDVNSLPVVSLGVGLGVDYGLYIVGRIDEEYRKSGNLEASITTSIATAGQAVLKEASTMIIGIIFWAFSFLRFQAEMGILLAFWMIVSMLGGLILLPTLIMLIKPKFILRQ